VAILSALLPYDADLNTPSTGEFDPPMAENDLDDLTPKEQNHLPFYRGLLKTHPPTDLTTLHRQLLLALRIFGDPARFDAHRLAAKEASITLPKAFSKYLSSKRD
jgi:hypothetical protein